MSHHVLVDRKTEGAARLKALQRGESSGFNNRKTEGAARLGTWFLEAAHSKLCMFCHWLRVWGWFSEHTRFA